MSALFFIGSSSPALADSHDQQNTEAAAAAEMQLDSVLPKAASSPSVLSAVTRAKVLLNNELEKKQASQKKPEIVWNKRGPFQIVIAVWNKDTDEITLLHGKKNKSSLSFTDQFPWKMRVEVDAGLFSQYSLPPESRRVIVGAIHPVLKLTKIKKKTAYEARDVIYTPYSSDLYTPEMLAAGSDYLSFLIKDAFDDMLAAGIRSRAWPDKLVVDVIDPYLIKSIVVIEHSGNQALLGDDPARGMGRFLVNLAANGEEAFDHSESRAGAVGLVQFIPSTYRRLVKRWPEIGLMDDFRKGMTNHKNAVKAMAAYLDEILSGMTAEVRELYKNDIARAGEIAAAAYNGGPTRVGRALKFWGSGWSESHADEMNDLQSKIAALKRREAQLKKQAKAAKTDKQAKAAKKELRLVQQQRDEAIVRLAAARKASLRKETVFYVAKLRSAYALFTSGAFATPRAPSGALPYD